MEGLTCFGTLFGIGCDQTGLTRPVLDFPNPGAVGNCSAIGGYVYRGSRMPDLRGTYFYGDFCSGFVRSFRLDASGTGTTEDVDHSQALDTLGSRAISSFGEDACGEILVVDYNGEVLRIVPAT